VRWKNVVFCLLGFWFPLAHADQWNCEDAARPTAIDKRTTSNIDSAFKTNSYEEILKELSHLQGVTHGPSLVAVYEAQAFAYQTVRRFDQVANAYRAVYDLEDAGMQSRIKARDNLASILLELRKPKDIIGLYTDSGRPVCGELGSEATYALASAYNAIGKDQLAQQVFDAGQARAVNYFSSDLSRLHDWLLLQLRLDCVQRHWQQCAADVERFANMELPAFPPVWKLNKLMPTLRRVPELEQTFASLEQRGIVDANGNFLTSKWLRDSDISIVSCPSPHYPVDARKNNISGQVVIDFIVDGNGDVRNVDVVRSNPPGVFEVVTLEAAWGCKFTKNIVNGQSISTWARQTFNFGRKP